VCGRDRDQVIRELLRLVTVEEQGRPTRWRVHRDELPDQVRVELQPFVDRRLLATDSDNGNVVIGVAHEGLLSARPPLSQAITAAATRRGPGNRPAVRPGMAPTQPPTLDDRP
jgi:hypothetical protein